MKCYVKDYPRPQFVRGNWENLNGCWKFSFDDEKKGEKEKWFREFPEEMSIQVPFSYETNASGIGLEGPHPVVWYQRTFEVDKEKLRNHKYILHFEGSDYLTKVWINGQYAGMHKGGYSRFSFDITLLVSNGSNKITVEVEDYLDMQQTRGKQRWSHESFHCWYVQTTGIWKSVWAEYVSGVCLDKVKMTPYVQKEALEITYELCAPEEKLKDGVDIETSITYGDNVISKFVLSMTERTKTIMIDIRHIAKGVEWGVKTWSPAAPNLYDIQFEVCCDGVKVDEVKSYFAMREITVDGTQILLNGEPLYQRLVLDQGYWRDSHLTPPSEDALIEDIDKLQQMGFNGVRKHQKLEDERFLYWCDVKGMLLWSEMGAAYQYTDEALAEFVMEWVEIVRQNYNHPCIITWTPMNESWGIPQIRTNKSQQQFAEAVYHITKALDPMRPVVTNDGWEHVCTDILTIHEYDPCGEDIRRRYSDCLEEVLSNKMFPTTKKPLFSEGYSYAGQPIFISEYGGIAFDKGESGWGYGDKVATEEEFLERFQNVTSAIKSIKGCCGYCYTQVTDIQQEVNGLMDIDRNFKVNPERIREINLSKG